MKLQTSLWPMAIFSASFITLMWFDYGFFSEGDHYKNIAIEQLENEKTEALTAEQAYSVQTVDIPRGLFKSTLKKQLSGRPLLQQEQFALQSVEVQNAILYKHSNRLIKKKKYSEQVELSRSISLQRRLQSNMQFDYARSLSKLEDMEAAIDTYQQLLEHKPNYQAATINLGLLLNKSHRYDEAEIVLTRAHNISSGSRKAKALSALASAQKYMAKWQLAEKNYAKSIEYRPGHASTWLKLADVRRQLNLPYVHTEKTYERSISLNSGNAQAWKKLGQYRLQKLDFSSAVAALGRAAELSARDGQLRLSMAWASFEAGKLKASRNHWLWLSKYAKSKKEKLLANHMLALLNNQKKQMKPLPIQQAEFQYALSLSLIDRGELESAQSKLQLIDKTSHWWSRAQVRLAVELVNAGRFDRANLIYSQLQLANNYEPEILKRKFGVIRKSGNQELALLQLDQALIDYPKSIALVSYKIELLMAGGNPQQLINYLDSLSQELYSQPDIQSLLKSHQLAQQSASLTRVFN